MWQDKVKKVFGENPTIFKDGSLFYDKHNYILNIYEDHCRIYYSFRESNIFAKEYYLYHDDIDSLLEDLLDLVTILDNINNKIEEYLS